MDHQEQIQPEVWVEAESPDLKSRTPIIQPRCLRW